VLFGGGDSGGTRGLVHGGESGGINGLPESVAGCLSPGVMAPMVTVTTEGRKSKEKCKRGS